MSLSRKVLYERPTALFTSTQIPNTNSKSYKKVQAVYSADIRPPVEVSQASQAGLSFKMSAHAYVLQCRDGLVQNCEQIMAEKRTAEG